MGETLIAIAVILVALAMLAWAVPHFRRQKDGRGSENISRTGLSPDEKQRILELAAKLKRRRQQSRHDP